MKNKHCEWCDHNFKTSLSYQIYCSAKCREEATKEKINQRYLQTRILKRVGKIRLCKNCKKNLSIYNDDKLCYDCQIEANDVSKTLKEIKEMFDDNK